MGVTANGLSVAVCDNSVEPSLAEAAQNEALLSPDEQGGDHRLDAQGTRDRARADCG